MCAAHCMTQNADGFEKCNAFERKGSICKLGSNAVNCHPPTNVPTNAMVTIKQSLSPSSLRGNSK